MFGREHLGRRARAARFLREPAMRVVNARSAIFLALRSVRPQTVWLPSYLCAAVADACVAANAATAFYPVDAHLRIAPSAFARVRRGDMVVVIDYFGFPHPPAIFRALRRAGAVVLEDASQAMFSAGVGRWADFVAYSPRKFVGVAEGGILALRRGRSATVTLARPPARWLRTARDAIRARTRFDASRTRATAGWFRLFQKAEHGQPLGAYAMTMETERCLRRLDVGAIAAARRRNYTTLLRTLSPRAVFPALPAGVVPLGFPIRLASEDARERLRLDLIDERIFPPVHWRLGGVVPRRFGPSHALAKTILTLPCDQRYGPADMRRIASVVGRS